jgi:hypothetical protein
MALSRHQAFGDETHGYIGGEVSPARIEGGAMTYIAVKPRCEDCPHNGEAMIGEAQAQYLEHVIEDEDRELGSLHVCATCHKYYSQFEGTRVKLPECLSIGPGHGLETCRFSPSRWCPFWVTTSR